MSIHHQIMNLKRPIKKLLMVVFDALALVFALWAAYALRLAGWWPSAYLEQGWWLFIATPVVGLLIFARLGLYRAVIRFMGSQAIWTIFRGLCLIALMMWSTAYFLELPKFPRSVPFNFLLVGMLLIGGSRLLVRNYYYWLMGRYLNKRPVLIYGAGGAGVQLASALANGAEYLPVGFLDDNKSLWKTTVAGLPVFKPNTLERLIEEQGVTDVLLALPSINRTQRRRILEQLSHFPVHVKTIPSMPELISGKIIEALREVELEDLLGREQVPSDESLFAISITDKVVMVTGAGGSIGSELCRQVLQHQPKALVLFEISEYALYCIEHELQQLCANESLKVPVYGVLGSVLNRSRVDQVIDRFAVQTIYHAAAYKHVPIVEHNIIEGVRNNALGTLMTAEAAFEKKVERFVLISTDKAVRPTNVMGASKRLAELILQDLAARASNTVFSMVRFGNVLGSSGSVVPLFQAQIESGGPVTVTHPEITRYFMTIPEAASLVLQAGSMAEGGEVFVLDMGEPVKIVELAQRMIQLMGHEVISDNNPQGDIAIEFTGLRPGEKLFEELLIGEDVAGTLHPKIMLAHEHTLEPEELATIVNHLQVAISQNNVKAVRELVARAVSDYRAPSSIVDWFDAHIPPASDARLH